MMVEWNEQECGHDKAHYYMIILDAKEDGADYTEKQICLKCLRDLLRDLE